MNDQMAPYRKSATAVVITTAMLSFISYWRAASLVMCDISSTAYYIGGIVEQSVGKAAPWFIMFIMFFSYLVRSVYIESCGMFVRAGVYRVVKAAMGSTLAKLAVSALIFDYILTGPISAVSAGQYAAGFINDLLRQFDLPLQFPPNVMAMAIAAAIVFYFWRKNIIGIHESSQKALAIMKITTVMVITLVGWSLLTLFLDPKPLPPLTPEIHEAHLGWLKGFAWAKTVGAIGVIIAISHAVLAMSGEETLAQVYREIGKPKLKNLRRAAMIIFLGSFVFTAICSFFAVMIIPDDVRSQYYDNLMSGLVMYLVGPRSLRLLFQGVVVIVGTLILAGACNTSIVGANSVLSRVAEDGVLVGWVRRPHARYGTTSRIITAVALAQLVTIILCRGDVLLLGEAYAFGVIWSFVFATLSVAILRFKDKSPRDWKVPLNIRIGSVEIPLMLIFTAAVLFFIGVTNFVTKTIATTWGMSFMIFFFVLLNISERFQKRLQKTGQTHVEQVNLRFEGEVTAEACGCIHERRVLVAVRDPLHLYQLRKTLEREDPAKTDVIVLTIDRHSVSQEGKLAFEKKHEIHSEDQVLLTNVVSVAEKYGAHVIPIVVPAPDPIFAVAKVAYELGIQEIVLGRSEATVPEVQLERLAFCWGFLAADTHRKVVVRIVWPQHELRYELS
ncbi:MAG: amino acid permease [Deltaproteobacteria bacterium]|nr:amino acid permease [Deltaproteobacteria bacterium]